ncbi:MAG: threonine synthase [Halococcoides sp.]
MDDASPTGYRCRACGAPLADDCLGPCPDCGGRPAVAMATTIDRPWTEWVPETIGDIAAGIGATPRLALPVTADRLGIDGLSVKREGANATGSIADRGLAVAIAAAAAAGHDRVALASPGPGARSAAALAARADLEATVAVPSRSQFDAKAMVNVYGGDMRVVEGRYPAAIATVDDLEGLDLRPFATGRRIAGLRTIAVELAADAPDAVVVPAGHGHLPVALSEGFAAAVERDALESAPAIVVVQPEGCAPLITGEAVAYPDTVCGVLEIPDPPAPEAVAAAVEATDGTRVAIPDDDALAAAVTSARADGVATSTAGGLALAAVERLRADGEIDPDDCVVIVDPLAARADADILRSHLMRTAE